MNLLRSLSLIRTGEPFALPSFCTGSRPCLIQLRTVETSTSSSAATVSGDNLRSIRPSQKKKRDAPGICHRPAFQLAPGSSPSLHQAATCTGAASSSVPTCSHDHTPPRSSEAASGKLPPLVDGELDFTRMIREKKRPRAGRSRTRPENHGSTSSSTLGNSRQLSTTVSRQQFRSIRAITPNVHASR